MRQVWSWGRVGSYDQAAAWQQQHHRKRRSHPNDYYPHPHFALTRKPPALANHPHSHSHTTRQPYVTRTRKLPATRTLPPPHDYPHPRTPRARADALTSPRARALPFPACHPHIAQQWGYPGLYKPTGGYNQVRCHYRRLLMIGAGQLSDVS